MGRFLNQDSYLGESGTPPSLHRYLYAYGNPTYYTDPTGNCVTPRPGIPLPCPVAPAVGAGATNQQSKESNDRLALKTEGFFKGLVTGETFKDAASGAAYLAEMFITKGAGFQKNDQTSARITAEDSGANPEPTTFPRAKPIDSSTDSTPVPVDTSSTGFLADERPQQGTPGYVSDGQQSGNSTADTAGAGQVNSPNVMMSEDPGLNEFVDKLRSGGIEVTGTNVEIFGENGKIEGEVDVVTPNALIQYKDGASSAQAVIKQTQEKTEPFVNRPVVTFVNDKGKAGQRTVKGAKDKILITNDIDELNKLIK